MLEGFTKIPLSKSRIPILSVTSNGLNFNGNVLSQMQKASYINFLVNEDKKQIAIQKCNELDEDKIRFFRQSKYENGVRINYREIQQIISRMISWDWEHYNYRVDGVYIANENAMIFDLKFARKSVKRNRN